MFTCSQIYFDSDLPKVTKLKEVQTLILSKLSSKLQKLQVQCTALFVSSDCWCGEWLSFATDIKYFYPLMYLQEPYKQLIK